MKFAQIARAVQAASGTDEPDVKRKVAADAIRSCDFASLSHATHFLAGVPFARVDPRTLRVGWNAIERALLALLPVDATTCRATQAATDDAGEALARLMEDHLPPALPGAGVRVGRADARSGLSPTVLEAADVFAKLVTARSDAKPRLLEAAWRRMTPPEAKCFTRIATGEARGTLGTDLLEEAIAQAFGRDLQAVRVAHRLSGDLGETAILAQDDRLAQARFRLFHPMGLLLGAAPRRPPADPAAPPARDEPAGLRAQLHAEDGRAQMYTSALESTQAFPEILEAARRLDKGIMLDGEVVAVDPDGLAAPRALLQQRLDRKRVSGRLRARVPVRFVAHDVLYLEGADLHARPLPARRSLLASLRLRPPLAVHSALPALPRTEPPRAPRETRRHSHEGLVLR